MMYFRLWFVSDAQASMMSKPPSTETVPSEIGYMNVIPKCNDCSGKYPHYENLPETYSAINVYLAANPLEGSSVCWTILHYRNLTYTAIASAAAHAHTSYSGYTVVHPKSRLGDAFDILCLAYFYTSVCNVMRPPV